MLRFHPSPPGSSFLPFLDCFPHVEPPRPVPGHEQALAMVATGISSLACKGFCTLGGSAPPSHTEPVPRERPACVGSEHTPAACSQGRGTDDIHGDSMHPGGQHASGGDSMHPEGQHASRGTAYIHGDSMHPEGEHASRRTVCVQRDGMHPGGQRVPRGTACVWRNNMGLEGQHACGGQHVSRETACIWRHTHLGDSTDLEGHRTPRGRRVS